MRSYSSPVLKFSDEFLLNRLFMAPPNHPLELSDPMTQTQPLRYPHESPPPRQQLASAVGIAVGDVCLSSMTTEEVTGGDVRMGFMVGY